MRLKPNTQFLVVTKRQWEAAATSGRAAQKKVIDDACASFDPPYSYAQMTRLLKLKARKRAHCEDMQVQLAEIGEYAEKVWNFKILADYDQKTFTIKQAFKAMQRSGQIPGTVTIKAIYAAIERMNLRNKSTSVAKKFSGGENALDMYQVDYSKSEYFHFNAKNEIFIANPAYTKKNESRIMIAAAVDYASRVHWFRYFFEEGESAVFVRNAILAAMEEKPAGDETTGEITGYRHILQGIPKIVYFDRGSGNAAAETGEGLRRLGVTKIKGANQKDSLGRMTNRSNKKGRGVIEKAIGDFKRNFEGELWTKHLLGELSPSLTLRELNEQVDNYCEQVNNAEHPVLDGHTRWELFEAAVATAKFPPDEARMYFTGNRMITVIGRLIRLSKTKIFIAPSFINDHEKVEVIPSGRDCYIFYNGESIKLKPQSGSMRDMMETETGSEFYEGMGLRERFADELDFASAGEISSIKAIHESLRDDVKEFFEKPRSVEEIKTKAAYFALSSRKMSAPNIIEYKEVIQ